MNHKIASRSGNPLYFVLLYFCRGGGGVEWGGDACVALCGSSVLVVARHVSGTRQIHHRVSIQNQIQKRNKAMSEKRPWVLVAIWFGTIALLGLLKRTLERQKRM